MKCGNWNKPLKMGKWTDEDGWGMEKEPQMKVIAGQKHKERTRLTRKNTGNCIGNLDWTL
jgi:hypothetical protein